MHQPASASTTLAAMPAAHTRKHLQAPAPKHRTCVRRLHPHHHGSASNQIATASLPIVVEQSPSGFDYWSDASCAAQKAAYYGGAEEVIMHFQVASRHVPALQPPPPWPATYAHAAWVAGAPACRSRQCGHVVSSLAMRVSGCQARPGLPARELQLKGSQWVFRASAGLR